MSENKNYNNIKSIKYFLIYKNDIKTKICINNQECYNPFYISLTYRLTWNSVIKGIEEGYNHIDNNYTIKKNIAPQGHVTANPK